MLKSTDDAVYRAYCLIKASDRSCAQNPAALQGLSCDGRSREIVDSRDRDKEVVRWRQGERDRQREGKRESGRKRQTEREGGR